MHPIRYHLIELAHPYRLRGAGNQQAATDGLIWAPGGRTLAASGVVETSTERGPGLGLGYVLLQNGSASAVCGIGVRIPNRYWIAGQWVDADATPFTDDTADAQDTGTGDFPLETTTNNDGFVIACRVPFNAVSIDIGTASVGATAVRAARYSNQDGSGWTNFATPMLLHDGAAGVLAQTGSTDANEALIVWDVPTNHGKIQTSGLSGIPGGFYAVNVRATTAPTTAAVADSLSLYRLYLLSDETRVEWAGAPAELGLERVGDALVALFETASDNNRVTVAARLMS